MVMTGKATGAVACCCFLTVLVLMAATARLWTRRVIQRRFELEDWLILSALFMTTAFLAGVMIGVGGLKYDLHTWQLSTTQLVNAAWFMFLGEFSYIVTSGIIKVAILLFYRRISDRRSSNGFVIILYTIMAEVIIYKVIYLLIILLSCRPLQARWNRYNPIWDSQHSYSCLSERLNLLTGSIISATEDLVIGLLPTMILWQLPVSWQQKLGLWCIFALSIVTSLTSYTRTYFIYQAYWSSQDVIGNLYWVFILGAIEVSFAIVCASAPVLKPFFAFWRLRRRSNGDTQQISGMNHEYAQSSITKFPTVSTLWIHQHPDAPDTTRNNIMKYGVNLSSSDLNDFMQISRGKSQSSSSA